MAKRRDWSKIPETYIYVLGWENVKVVKVGMTTNIRRRFNTIQYGLPFPPELLYVVAINHEIITGRRAERHLRKELCVRPLQGEWVVTSGPLLADFPRHGAMFGEMKDPSGQIDPIPLWTDADWEFEQNKQVLKALADRYAHAKARPPKLLGA